MRNLDDFVETLKGFLIGLVICGIITLLFGCSSARQFRGEEKEVERSVSAMRDSVDRLLMTAQRDSVNVRDSVSVVYVIGQTDTMWNIRVDTLREYNGHWEWRGSADVRIDTLVRTIHRTDTITKWKTKTEVVEVEKKLTWWEKVRMELGEVFLVWVVVIIIGFIYRLRK